MLQQQTSNSVIFLSYPPPLIPIVVLFLRSHIFVCVCVCVCACVCVCEEYHIMFIYSFFWLKCIFVGLTDFVKHDVLILVDGILSYRNYHYYYYDLNHQSNQ